MSRQSIVRDYVKAFREMMMESEDAMYRALKAFHIMTVSLRYEPDLDRRLILDILWKFQKDIAMIQDLPRCPYCEWVIYPDTPHHYCEETLQGKREVFSKDYRQHRERIALTAYATEVCRCGHFHCDCDDDQEKMPIKTFLGDPPGGFYIYE